MTDELFCFMCYTETLDELEQWVTNIFQHIHGKWVCAKCICCQSSHSLLCTL